MSDTPMGPGWWLASDGKWYPPEQQQPPTMQPPTMQPSMPPMMSGSRRSSADNLVFIALGLACAGLVFNWLCGLFGPPFGIAAITCGVIGLAKKKKAGDTENRWVGWLSIGLGSLTLIFFVLFIVLLAGGFGL